MPPGVVISTRAPLAAPAEAAPFVRWYRRLLPRPLRRLLVLLTPHGSRDWVKDRIAALTLRRLRRAGLLAIPGHTMIKDGGQLRLAIVSSAASPMRARNENLRLVCGALEDAGIDHFVVRGYENNAASVGVCGKDRQAAGAALIALCGRVPGYLSPAERKDRPATAIRWGGEPKLWERLADHRVLRFTCYHTDPSRSVLLGARHGCDIEFWDRLGDRLVAPRANRVTADLPAAGEPVRGPAYLFTQLARPTVEVPGPRVRTRAEFLSALPDDIGFPIDAVYTWVDGTDPRWQQRRASVTDQPYHPEAANEARYVCHDELRYSLRSVHQYAPWIRRIYLVTDRQVPAWLDTSSPGLQVVDHRDIFRDPSCLPTFNSHAIETQLHHIEGLAEHFLYFNDDVFLGRPVVPQDFFCPSGNTKFFPSRALVPLGPPQPGDIPSSAAGKNNRALLERRFGTVVTQKMKHMPHALRRSLLAEIEAEFPRQHQATAASRIRSLSDLSIPSALHHYYAFQTGRALPGRLRYHYCDLAHPEIEAKLQALLRLRNYHTFCVNDTESSQRSREEQLALIQPILAAYFPLPAPCERGAALDVRSLGASAFESDGQRAH